MYQLSSEPHSFSRIFTGAFFEILGVSLAAKAAIPGGPTEAELLAVADDLAGFLVQGVKCSPIVPNWYAQVAANMRRRTEYGVVAQAASSADLEDDLQEFRPVLHQISEEFWPIVEWNDMVTAVNRPHALSRRFQYAVRLAVESQESRRARSRAGRVPAIE